MLTPEQIDAAWRSVDYTLEYEDFRIAIGRAIEAEVRKEIEAAHQQAIAAAVLGEREAIAQWYEADGWLMDESDIADAIRARTQPAPTTEAKNER